MRGDVTAFLEIKIVDLIPDTFLIALDDNPFHPMGTAVEDTIAAFGIYIRVPFCICERNRDLPHLSFFRDVKHRLLIIDFHRLDVARVDIAILDLIPSTVKRITQLAIFVDGYDLYNRVRAEKMDLVGFERGSIIKRHAAECNAALLDRRRVGKRAVEAQVA